MRSCQRSERARRAYAGLALSVVACAAPPEAQSAPEKAPAPRMVTGQLLSRYRGRFTGGDSDHDLYETVDLTLADPEERWSGSLLARAAFDADGRDGGDPRTFDVLDTYSRFAPQLFHVYLDVNTGPRARLRLGRQSLYQTPLTVVLDGLSAELLPRGERRLALGAFAGIGEHLYESSSDGDTVLGGFGSLRAWEGAELRADWMHLADARLGIEHEDDLYGLALSQDVARARTITRLEARFTSLEGNGRDLRLLASHVDAPGRWSLQGSVYQLLQAQRALAAPLDPFSDTLFELFPYAQLGLSLSKDWEHLALLSGTDLRRVSDPGDEGTHNREFERYFLTGTLPDALPVSVSLTGELWRATDTDLETWGAAVQREFDGGWNVTLGSHFALYEYDHLSGQERDHVRSTYLDLRWRTDTARRWTLRCEFERNEVDDFQTLELDYAWGF